MTTGGAVNGEAATAATRARWLHLTRAVLRGMAARQGWTVRLDHCFMRICLDNAFEARWDRVVRRPAIRHLNQAQLSRAVAIAEGIVADPRLLSSLNARSLGWRIVR